MDQQKPGQFKVSVEGSVLEYLLNKNAWFEPILLHGEGSTRYLQYQTLSLVL